MYVLKGKPEIVFPEIFETWNVTKLTFEEDTEPYAVERDEKISKLAKEANIEVKTMASHTLYDTKV